MTRLPIRIRLTLGFALAMALVLAAVGLFVYQRVSNELLAGIDQTLVAQAHEETESGHVDADTGGGTTYAQLFTPTGALQASQPRALPPLLGRRLLSEAAAGRLYRDRTLPGSRGEWRVLAVPSTSGRGVVVVARSLAPRASSLDHLRHELALFLPLALLAACLGGYALTARALRPVELLRRRAGAVTAESQALLPVPPSRDEISRLATTLNDMLARLHAAVEHERRFVADASHELRTPLSLLQTELELALRRPRSHEELEQALRSAAEETQRLTRLANDLLLIARADQGPLPIRREAVPAGALLEGVAQRFEIRAASLRRELVLSPASWFSTPTSSASNRRSRTSSRTRSPTAEARFSCAPSSRSTPSNCTSRTRARGFQRSSARGPSTASAAPTRRGVAVAPASASRSSTSSPEHTVARRACAIVRRTVPTSGCRCRAPDHSIRLPNGHLR